MKKPLKWESCQECGCNKFFVRETRKKRRFMSICTGCGYEEVFEHKPPKKKQEKPEGRSITQELTDFEKEVCRAYRMVSGLISMQRRALDNCDDCVSIGVRTNAAAKVERALVDARIYKKLVEEIITALDEND